MFSVFMKQMLELSFVGATVSAAITGGSKASVVEYGDSGLLAAGVEALGTAGAAGQLCCAAAVMKLAELGLADLDTPVFRIAPDCQAMDRRITLGMCLNGFPEPGEGGESGPDCLALAQMAVAHVSGMDYQAFVRRYILPKASGGIAPWLGLGGLNTGQVSASSGKSLSRQGGQPGLGWDSAALTVRGYDFGPGALGKYAEADRFVTAMAVSPANGLSAVITATRDELGSARNAMILLAEMSAAWLELRGVSIRVLETPAIHLPKAAASRALSGGRRSLAGMQSAVSTGA